MHIFNSSESYRARWRLILDLIGAPVDVYSKQVFARVRTRAYTHTPIARARTRAHARTSHTHERIHTHTDTGAHARMHTHTHTHTHTHIRVHTTKPFYCKVPTELQKEIRHGVKLYKKKKLVILHKHIHTNNWPYHQE